MSWREENDTEEDFAWIRNNRDQALKNMRDDAIWSIREGHDTWERITEVALKFNSEKDII